MPAAERPGVFQEVGVTWGGREYVIPPSGMLRVIAEIEGIVTMADLHIALQSGRLPLAKIAMAYGVMLRSAGCDVEDDAIYDVMFQKNGVDMKKTAFGAIAALQALMVPPEHLRDRGGAKGKPGKPGAAARPAASSRKSTG